MPQLICGGSRLKPELGAARPLLFSAQLTWNEIRDEGTDLAWCGTGYRRICEKCSCLTRPREQNGRILRPSRVTSGSAGLSPSRNRKPEGSTLSEYARNSKKECADLVAGPAALTAEIKTVPELQTSGLLKIRELIGLTRVF
jgi:hypothetical protein